MATVAIGGGLDAGLLAAAILATADPVLAEALESHRRTLHDQVVARDARLQALGTAACLEEMRGPGAGRRRRGPPSW